VSIQTTFNFNSALSYVLSNTQIAANVAKLALVPNPAQLFQQLFSSSVGFTFDATKAEFVGGVLQQKDQRPAGATFYNSFASLNANWSSGSGTGTAGNGAVVSGGLLDLSGAAQRYLDYSATANADFQQTGTVRLKVKPGYSGSPGQLQYLFTISESGASFRNMIVLEHLTSGNLQLRIYDQSAVNLVTSSLGAWSPVAGTTYEIELNLDLTTGATRLFINGVQLGSTIAVTGTRSSAIGLFRIGQYFSVQNVTNLLAFDSVAVFNSVQHTANYTPGAALSDTLFAASSVSLPAFSYTGIGTVLAVESSAIVEAGAPRYIVAGQWFNGTAWAISSGAYSQANTSAEIIANLPTINASGATTIPVSVVFTDTNTQGSVDSVSVTVTGQKYATSGYVEPSQALQVQELLAYSETSLIPANSELKIILKIDGVLKWYNGTAWVTSDGTSAQANDAADLDAPTLALLSLTANASVFVRWVFTSSANTATSELSQAIVNYDFGGVRVDAATCIVYGYLKDVTNTPVSGAVLKFDLVVPAKTEYKEAASNIIFKATASVTSDTNGYFEVELIRSSEYEGTLAQYRLTVTKSAESLSVSKISEAFLDFTVPDAEEVDITTLITAA
jgi:hypothetical protein